LKLDSKLPSSNPESYSWYSNPNLKLLGFNSETFGLVKQPRTSTLENEGLDQKTSKLRDNSTRASLVYCKSISKDPLKEFNTNLPNPKHSGFKSRTSGLVKHPTTMTQANEELDQTTANLSENLTTTSLVDGEYIS
jgi:hypothetical protein